MNVINWFFKKIKITRINKITSDGSVYVGARVTSGNKVLLSYAPRDITFEEILIDAFKKLYNIDIDLEEQFEDGFIDYE